jgi:putative transposase
MLVTRTQQVALTGDHFTYWCHKANYLVRQEFFGPGTGTAINADVNAAYNIIRKVFPNAFAEGMGDASLHPECRNMFSACECT